MIKAGEFFCPMCANVDTQAFYKVGSRPTGIRLTHKKHGGGFQVEGIDLTDERVIPNVVELVSKLDAKNDGDGIPERITVRFHDDRRTVDATRYCRFCACAKDTHLAESINTKLFRNNGRHPLYVVAMVGDRNSGKTAWLDATSYPPNIDAVNEMNYPFKLNYLQPSGQYGKSEATPEWGRGSTKFLEIINKEDQKVVAQVLLLDVAGELFLSCPDILRRLTEGYTAYTGPDAFIFTESAVSTSQVDVMEQSIKANDIYKNCKENGVFQGKPVAWVLTHFDHVIEKGNFPKKLESSGQVQIPVCSRATFSPHTSYVRSALLDRLAIEHSIARAYRPHVLMDAPGSSNHGFLVQSCTTISHPKLGLTEDRSTSLHVMDPLLWVLNQLHIFPLTEGGFC